MGKLTTHVLDTMSGAPAAGMRIELSRLGDDAQRIANVQTNSDGRCDGPLLASPDMTPGEYELVFFVGDYFSAAEGVTDPPFLGQVPIRFSIADPDGHYHVPLLTSPWSYTTYRGS